MSIVDITNMIIDAVNCACLGKYITFSLQPFEKNNTQVTLWCIIRLNNDLRGGDIMASKHIGICRLCKQECELKDSHIVPKFFYNLIKKNSPTGRFRTTDNPNIPYQYGKKLPFLCGDCEEKFSKYETYFSQARHYLQRNWSINQRMMRWKGYILIRFLFQISNILKVDFS